MSLYTYIRNLIGRFLKKENSPLQTDDKFIDTTAVD